MQQIKKQLGVIRSYLIYYLKPFNGIRLRRFYSQFINKGDLCFDLGAHLGNRTNAWLKLGAKVVAVEPQPVCINFLEKKFNRNAAFALVSKAVGEKLGTAKFRISSLYPTISTLSTEWEFSKDKRAETLTYWDDEVQVEITTLDILINEYGLPKFCKIDVEDLELEVLKGLSHTIPSLSFEFFPIKTDKAILCIKELQRLGNYQFNVSFKEYLKLKYKDWLSSDEIIKFLDNYDDDISGDVYAMLRK